MALLLIRAWEGLRMAGTLGQSVENALLGLAFGAAAYTPAATHYLALFTAAPTSTGGGTEVAGGAYARVSHTNNLTTWPAPSGSPALLQNGVAFTFPQATAAWGVILAWAIFDAATGGNLVAWGLLNTSKTVGIGDTPSFAVDALTLTLT
jgi:hypothetical protein